MAKDMRLWIEQLEAAGELQHVKEQVDTDAGMAQMLGAARDKALVFENIKGHQGWKVLGAAPANMRHVALALGTEREKVNTRFATLMDKGPTKCKQVKTGPVKEIILKGKDIRLTDLPIHVQGEKDKAPFITTGLCMVKNPETGKANIAFHRLQLKGNDKLGIMMQPERHSWLIYEKYQAMGKNMPIAIMIGHHPMYYFAAAYTGPLGMDELEVAGTLLEEPVEVVKCETSDINVPAYAEIVIEGEVLAEYREDEGPFSEFQNYYAQERKNPAIKVNAVTMRKGAIYKALQHAPPNEGIYYVSVPMGAALMRDLKNVAGFADIKDVYCNWGSPFGVVIKMTPRFYGEAKQVLMAACSAGYLHPKIAVAVDEDVDIYDAQDVAWAVTTRVNPSDQVSIIDGVIGHPLDISAHELTDPELTILQRMGSRMLIDATKPPTSDPRKREYFERSRPPASK